MSAETYRRDELARPPEPSSLADQVHGAYARLEILIKAQSRASTLFVLVSLGLFFVLYAAMTFLLRTPSDEGLLQELHNSNEQVATMLQAMAGQTPGVPASLGGKVIEAAVAQAALHQKATEEIRRTRKEIAPTGLALLQLLGGSAVLALLGYLGLQRLQNLDTEINNLREFMFRQIKERIEEGRQVLGASVEDAVRDHFRETQDELKALSDQFRTLTTEETNKFVRAAAVAASKLAEVESRVTAISERYSWLDSAEVRDSADAVSSLASVEQAHDVAVLFRFANDARLARLALEQISERSLPGNSVDFHNAHTEANRLKEPLLALAIAEEGLKHFPDQYDLMADKALALINSGRGREARDLLEDWRRRKPAEFARGWRPVVFYADVIESDEITQEGVQKLEQAMDSVTKQLPLEIKPWSKYARFEIGLGKVDKAEKILLEGLKHNPLSQELNYVYGELLIRIGRVEEGVKYLEKAVQVDFQDQFQHDVSQDAVKATLAQAYEALGEAEKAEALYLVLLKLPSDEARRHVRVYARNRLLANAALRGETLELPTTDGAKPADED